MLICMGNLPIKINRLSLIVTYKYLDQLNFNTKGKCLEGLNNRGNILGHKLFVTILADKDIDIKEILKFRIS